ncbi:MAG: PAS domain-containing protein [Asgard group archaeon]|nr:PAS domain-containing protein [Asgard group archaeon]
MHKIPSPIWVLSDTDKFLYVNEYFIDFFGKSLEEIQNKRLVDVFSKDNADTIRSYNEIVLQKKEGLQFKDWFLDANDERRFLAICIAPFFSKKNDLLEIIYFAQDITDCKFNDEDLGEIQQHLKTAMREGTLAWWEMHLPSGRVLFGKNKIEMIGYSMADFKNAHYKDFTDLIHPEDKAQAMKAMREHLKGKKDLYETDYRIKARDGSWIWFHDRGKITKRSKNGKPTVVTGLVIDITERIEMEKKLRESEANYRHAYQQASFFKDLVAHDINNMLQGILMSLNLCGRQIEQEKKSDELLLKYLQSIEEQVEKGTKLIQRLQLLSSYSEGKITLKKVHLKKVLQEAIKSIKSQFPEKNMKIALHDSNNYYVYAGDLLFDAFQNILHNGIKHNTNKKIILDIKTKISERNGEKIVEIHFSDNGVGIPDDLKSEVFTKSFKSNKKTQGMGLGLSLVKRIIETYNGTISIKNRIADDYSKGSTFIITLPIYEKKK